MPAGRTVAEGAAPRLTVITPSYNQAQYLEATIRSVLEQGYPNLDYWVMDGGSTDGSRAIIERYAHRLSGWACEKDGGQADAILKGLASARGEWFVWINSDDLLAPGALATVARHVAGADVVAGTTRYFDDAGERGSRPSRRRSAESLLIEHMGSRVKWHQPAVWMRREPFLALNPSRNFHFAFDWDWLIRYLQANPRVHEIPDVLASFRYHGTSKTVSHAPRFRGEQIAILAKLREDPAFAPLRPTVDRAWRGAQWLQSVDALLDDRATPRWRRFWQVVRGAGEDRPARCTPNTRRAASRILKYGGRKP